MSPTAEDILSAFKARSSPGEGTETHHGRFAFCRDHAGFLCCCGWIRSCVRSIEVTMSLESILILAISSCLILYLLYALLHPEKL